MDHDNVTFQFLPLIAFLYVALCRNINKPVLKFLKRFGLNLWTKGQTISKANYGLLKSRSFFGRIEETINCFRDLLTFSNACLLTFLDLPKPWYVFKYVLIL